MCCGILCVHVRVERECVCVCVVRLFFDIFEYIYLTNCLNYNVQKKYTHTRFATNNREKTTQIV